MTTAATLTKPCEFLGNEDDRWTRTSLPWPGHRCFASGKPSEVARVQQGLFCLTSNHTGCPTYVLAMGMREATEPLPAAASKPSRKERTSFFAPSVGLLLRLGLIAAIVVMVIALDATILRPFYSESARSAPIVTPNPNVTTYTLFPPTRTPAQQNGDAAPRRAATMVPATPPPASPTARPVSPTAQPAELAPNDGQARISMQPGAGPRGSRVNVSGANWTPNVELALRWGPSANEDGVVELVKTRAGATGSFTGSVLLPSEATGTVYVSIRQGDRAA